MKLIDKFEIRQKVRPWDEYTTYGRPVAYVGKRKIEIEELIYRWQFYDTKRRSDNFVGSILVVHSRNREASLEIEVRVHEMAEFCKKYLAEYNKVAHDMGWNELP